MGADHVGLGLDFAAEGEEEYAFYGYDEVTGIMGASFLRALTAIWGA